MKRFILLLMMTSALGAVAQTVEWPTDDEQAWKPKAFEHLDLSLTAGTTGLGLELASPVNDLFRVRAGFSFMPHISPTLHFGVQVGDNPETSQSKFERLSGLLESFTGYKVDNTVDMKGQPIFYNFNLMLDVTPFRNKNWHLTAGLYVGPSKVARAFNTTEDMPSLMAVGIYNNLYNKVIQSPVLTDPDYFMDNSLVDVLGDVDLLKLMGFDFSELDDMLGNAYFDPDDNPVKRFYQKIADYGRMGIHIGDYSEDVVDEEGNVIHAKGSPYIMEPNGDSMVKAWVKVNNWKPYLGFGYSGRMLKNDDSWRIGFDAGVWLWGGTPKIITHDGTDLIGDVKDVPGKVGRYVDVIEQFKVYPAISLRISKRLF